MTASIYAKHTRRAMTLVEMLVVVGIIVLLAAITVPAIRPMLESQAIREGGRTVHGALTQARLRAIELQRPCGIRFERYADHQDNSTTCVRMYQLESPPPYGGLSTTARVVLKQTATRGLYEIHFKWNDGDVDPNEVSAWKKLIDDGDEIQFNYQGRRYRIDAFNSTGPSSGDIKLDSALDWTDPDSAFMQDTTKHPLDKANKGLPFTVFRGPEVASTKPIVLRNGAVVDLHESGFGDSGRQLHVTDQTPADPHPVDIIFSPSGAVDTVHFEHWTDHDNDPATPDIVVNTKSRRTDMIFLNVGRWDRTFHDGAASGTFNWKAEPEDGLRNHQDMGNLWVVISPKTGLVTMNSVNFEDNSGGLDSPLNTDMPESRRKAQRVQQSMGGR